MGYFNHSVQFYLKCRKALNTSSGTRRSILYKYYDVSAVPIELYLAGIFGTKQNTTLVKLGLKFRTTSSIPVRNTKIWDITNLSDEIEKEVGRIPRQLVLTCDSEWVGIRT